MFRKLLSKLLFNYKKPYLNRYIFNVAERYAYFYKGECNADMETNGENKLLNILSEKDGLKYLLDVGANVGEYTERVLKLNPNLIAHCFEPNSDAFKELQSKFGPYKKNITCNNFALGDKQEAKNLYGNDGYSSFSSFFPQGDKIKLLQVVEVKTLDDYCRENKVKHIDLLKIDVEGNEMAVLKGGDRMLREKAIDMIQFEYGHAAIPAHLFLKDFADFFKQYGYVLYKIKPNELELINYTPWMEGCPYANFIAIRPGYIYLDLMNKL